ncbi:MAG TPA: HNH endonuclease signature motif containing protein [Streptosporangiaceae bacterium]
MEKTCGRCDRKPVAKGLCDAHYRQARKAGLITARERDPVKRFWSKVDRNGPTPSNRPELGQCWDWTAGKDDKGYGRVGWGGRTLLVHRVAYELAVGPIGPLTIDHLCRRPPCCNPDHLEPVTIRENTARGLHVSATALRTNRCIHGHEYTPENTYWWKGERQCRTCLQARPRPYVPRPRPSKVKMAEAVCEICDKTFSYLKVRRARTVCSDECRKVRHRRIRAAYKARKRATE